MRILDTGGSVFSLEKLGFSESVLKIIQENISKPNGMFLVTGPTGSGKSTTLYSILQILNKETVNVSTLEDPVEYFFKGINQSQINSDIGMTFASGLRALLRQDPDIIMVGEIRDGETGEIGVHSALTGHLVLSTLHTNDAIGAVPRMIDMHIEPFLLSASLNAVLAQRLVRRVCDHCSVAIEVPEKMIEILKKEIEDLPDSKEYNKYKGKNNLKIFRGKGCPRCRNTGYTGRSIISEILPITDTFSDIVAQGFETKEAWKEFRNLNLITLREDGIIKALKGITSLEEVFRVTKSR